MTPEKSVRLSAHARLQLGFRGTNEGEIVDAIRTAPWQVAEQGRLECRKDFPYNADWNGKRYATKQVRPIFADEPTEIVVVTVYVYYF
jgi:hypothetical protein